MLAARRVALLVGCLLAGALVGCEGVPEVFVVAPASPPSLDQSGLPGVRFERTTQNHVVIISAPTPGYEIEFDGVTQAFDRDASFITLRRPPESVAPAQVVVEHAIDTRVALTRPVMVYLRIVDAKQKKRGVAFQPVGERAAEDTE